MAGLGKKTFVNGDGLPASELNGYLMEQSVMRFASAAARNTAIPSPTEGMVCYLDDVNWLMFYNGSSWVISGGEKPYLFASVTQNITSGSFQAPSVSASVNRGSFTVSSGTITVANAGVYNVSAYLNYPANATGQRYLEILINGSAQAIATSVVNSASANTQITASVNVLLASGGTIKLQAYQNSGATLNTSAQISIAHLGA